MLFQKAQLTVSSNGGMTRPVSAKSRLSRNRYLDHKSEVEPFLIPHTKVNSKWIVDLNARAQTIKFRRKHGSK